MFNELFLIIYVLHYFCLQRIYFVQYMKALDKSTFYNCAVRLNKFVKFQICFVCTFPKFHIKKLSLDTFSTEL